MTAWHREYLTNAVFEYRATGMQNGFGKYFILNN